MVNNNNSNNNDKKKKKKVECDDSDHCLTCWRCQQRQRQQREQQQQQQRGCKNYSRFTTTTTTTANTSLISSPSLCGGGGGGGRRRRRRRYDHQRQHHCYELAAFAMFVYCTIFLTSLPNSDPITTYYFKPVLTPAHAQLVLPCKNLNTCDACKQEWPRCGWTGDPRKVNQGECVDIGSLPYGSPTLPAPLGDKYQLQVSSTLFMPDEKCSQTTLNSLNEICVNDFGRDWAVVDWSILSSNQVRLSDYDLRGALNTLHIEILDGDTEGRMKEKSVFVKYQERACVNGNTPDVPAMVGALPNGQDFPLFAHKIISEATDADGLNTAALIAYSGYAPVLCAKYFETGSATNDIDPEICTNRNFFGGSKCVCPAAPPPGAPFNPYSPPPPAGSIPPPPSQSVACHEFTNCLDCSLSWPPCGWSLDMGKPNNGECLSVIDDWMRTPVMPLKIGNTHYGITDARTSGLFCSPTLQSKMDQICATEFGSGMSVMDWTDLRQLDRTVALSLMQLLHLDVHEGESSLVWEAQALVMVNDGDMCGPGGSFFNLVRADQQGHAPPHAQIIDTLPGLTADIPSGFLSATRSSSRILCRAVDPPEALSPQKLCDRSLFFTGECMCPEGSPPPAPSDGGGDVPPSQTPPNASQTPPPHPPPSSLSQIAAPSPFPPRDDNDDADSSNDVGGKNTGAIVGVAIAGIVLTVAAFFIGRRTAPRVNDANSDGHGMTLAGILGSDKYAGAQDRMNRSSTVQGVNTLFRDVESGPTVGGGGHHVVTTTNPLLNSPLAHLATMEPTDLKAMKRSSKAVNNLAQQKQLLGKKKSVIPVLAK